MSRWQPIETAPKNATRLILGNAKGLHNRLIKVCTGVWCSYDNKWVSVISERTCTPTHWMPLPEPPAKSLNEKKADIDE
jgi:hypothetical protein